MKEKRQPAETTDLLPPSLCLTQFLQGLVGIVEALFSPQPARWYTVEWGRQTVLQNPNDWGVITSFSCDAGDGIGTAVLVANQDVTR